MNPGRYLLAVLVGFAVIFGYDYLVHGVLMMDQYEATMKLWRPQAPMYMMVMAASQLFYAIMFVYIFTKNYESLGIPEGVRYGLYIGLLVSSLDLAAYAYLPVPFMLIVCSMGANIVKGILVGAVTAAVYKQ